MSPIIRRSLQMLAGLLATGFLAVLGLLLAYLVLAPGLPSVEAVRNVELQVPLRVYTAEGDLIDEFGEMRRTPVSLASAPDSLKQAFLAAEDQRFYEHPGVDYQGLARAVWYLVRTGEKGPGGSTITMQLARNLFLTSERTYLRKLREILLALRIEQQLDKDTILELYLNKIYLGQRAYGVAAAAEVYYGKPLDQLSLAEHAMIAGLPKAPSASNPLSDPARALGRRSYVLGRMLEVGVITPAAYESAMAEPLTAAHHRRQRAVSAPFVAEMVRAWMVERYGQQAAYTTGYEVHTTISTSAQRNARSALRNGLNAYDERHGYRGALGAIDPALLENPGSKEWAAALDAYPVVADLAIAVVESVGEQTATVRDRAGEQRVIPWSGLAWARQQLGRNAMGPNPDSADDILAIGDVIRMREAANGLRLAQIPEPQAGLVALKPDDGAIQALVGGYAFAQSKFNRVTQATRQPGSAFKPMIYSAALANGFTPATLVNDAPVVFPDASLEDVWRPENYSGRVFGPTRLREALTYSRNLVSIRLLRRIGVGNAIDHLEPFGFPAEQLPRNLSLALGSADVTPLQLARAYAVFANGGYRVEPYFIDRVTDREGEVVHRAWPHRAASAAMIEPAAPGAYGPQRPDARPAPRAISEQNAWLMRSMLESVVREGTARSAQQLGRNDLSGKTGTTNDQRDAWFSGFNGDLVTTTWVGFDDVQSLGRYETGGRAALPIWIDFMGAALRGKPNSEWPRPDGLITVRIDPETGLRTDADNPAAIFETFPTDQLPAHDNADGTGRERDVGGATQPIF